MKSFPELEDWALVEASMLVHTARWVGQGFVSWCGMVLPGDQRFGLIAVTTCRLCLVALKGRQDFGRLAQRRLQELRG